jgi:small redox-active disulfide protein 2
MSTAFYRLSSIQTTVVDRSAEGRVLAMTIQVLGRGCGPCEVLHVNTVAAVSELGLDTPVEKVYDEAQIARAGVPSTPALAVDGRVLICGAVPSVTVVRNLLAGAMR